MSDQFVVGHDKTFGELAFWVHDAQTAPNFKIVHLSLEDSGSPLYWGFPNPEQRLSCRDCLSDLISEDRLEFFLKRVDDGDPALLPESSGQPPHWRLLRLADEGFNTMLGHVFRPPAFRYVTSTQVQTEHS